MKLPLFFFTFLIFLTVTNAQYIDGATVNYGNEWIDFNKEYIKITLDQDGIYRVTKQELLDAGFDVNNIPMTDFALFHLGKQVPIYTSVENLMSDDDYIEFFGQRNKNEIDKYYFQNEAHQLNPEFSLITDESAYFLTSISGNNPRYNDLSTTISGNLPPKENYYMHEVHEVYASTTGNSYMKSLEGNSVRFSNGQITEGFGDGIKKITNKTLPTSNIYNNGISSIFKVRLGTNAVQHNIDFKIGSTVLKNFSFAGYNVLDEELIFSTSLLSPNTTLNITGKNSNSDLHNLSSISLFYPRTFNFDQDTTLEFSFEASPFDRYFELNNFDSENGSAVAFDFINNRRITSVNEGGITKFISPASLSGNDFYIVSPRGLKKIKSSKKVSFEDYSTLDYNYLILSNEKLFDDGKGNDWVQSYADYRASSFGGNFNPVIIDASTLYDQFSYGIENHFLGIKSFLNYVHSNWPNLEYVFIIGKGREFAQYRYDEQKEKDLNAHVPTFGYPGSDNLLMSQWGETSPKVPIGRLAARTPEEVKIYYSKVILHEQQINNPQTIEDKLWMKKILHLSGGDPSIAEYIKGYLKNMENIITNNSFGADVTTFYKASSDPIEVTQSDKIIRLIDDGLSVITFFGHSAIGVFDLNLEDVSAYNNKGKYPIILSLGCHSGNVHTSATGLSQQFVLAEDKGSIAFLAASAQAFISNQDELGKDFYELLGGEYYGKPLGDIVKKMNDISESKKGYAWETLLQQLTLHGDPAVKLHAGEGEDYIPDYSSVNIEPKIINAYQDDFELCFDVVNIGKSDPKELSIQIEHLGPKQEINLDTSIIRIAPSNRSNFCLTIPLKTDDLVGKNQIKIKVDDKNFIAELPDPAAENNNSLRNSEGAETFDFFILNNGAVPVYPKQYAIYNQEDVMLLASSFNALGNKQSYVMQLDTTDAFNSPFLKEEIINNASGLISWEPDFEFTPGVVYYWRVSPENSIGAEETWQSSSFLYLPSSSEGWNQSHLNQFEDNDFDELQLENRKLEYVADYRDMRILNRVVKGEDYPGFFVTGVFFNNAYRFQSNKPFVAIVAFDSLGNIRWNEAAGSYGAINPDNETMIAFYFNMALQDSRINLVNFIDTVLEKGDFVYFYTVHPANINTDFKPYEWAADSIINNGKNIFNVLENQGAQKFDDFRKESVVPYNFIFRKDKSPTQEGKAEDINGTADNTAAVFGRWYKGKEISVKIGPATKWKKFVWKDDPKTIMSHDSSYMQIFGVSQDGKDSLLFDKILEKEINLAQINPNVFPYLKLVYNTYDIVDRSSPDLDFWRVFYTGQAELALDILDDQAEFHSDTLNQGDDFRLKIPLKNIGLVDVDSIVVHITLTDQENNAILTTTTLSPIKIGEQEYIIYDVPTQNLSGIYTVTLEANIDKNPEECHYFNNFGLRQFIVRGDIRNPLLDVSFDGRRIMNGDLVSAEPFIRIVTKDDNKYLLMNDTSTYEIYLIDPDGISNKLNFSDPNILFIPANDVNNNQNEINYTPKLEKDGNYTLRVSSKDASGNISGDQDFTVDFKVINEELISNILNYPNPFSDCTQFVFTLTGNEMPQDLYIRIMTVSGKVVKEISGTELGPLRIGVNRTEYRWCGTDEFGSKLANGVYLYQVVTKKSNGELYDKYDTNTNQFFKHNIGKLVIMR